MTPARLNELRALCDAATEGPWKTCGASDDRCKCGHVWSRPRDGHIATAMHIDQYAKDDPGRLEAEELVPHDLDEMVGNARFIAAARTAIPELLDEIERLKKLIGDDISAMDGIW